MAADAGRRRRLPRRARDALCVQEPADRDALRAALRRDARIAGRCLRGACPLEAVSVLPPAAPPGKRCLVAYATRERQYLWSVELSPEASILDALIAARAAAGPSLDIPWDSAAVGIFGERRARADPCADGDRIELYRALRGDPREQRRQRVARERRGC
ncbi:MAG: RnfH family protein [Gammaproteobacteria bacterium]|nr:MAG: RnfH family protein [Gammaproteobacteria bacterium]TLZ08186.1 MAG: RnfH family protein [Gammaproteobacteria bacterium]TLZ11291.1 MAG: RnfH family protein [Gammaproteobacteria bacterium]